MARGEAVDGRHEQILPPLRAELIEEGRAERRGEERVRTEQTLHIDELCPNEERQREQGQEPEAEEQVKADLQQPEPPDREPLFAPVAGRSPRLLVGEGGHSGDDAGREREHGQTTKGCAGGDKEGQAEHEGERRDHEPGHEQLTAASQRRAPRPSRDRRGARSRT